MSAPRTASRQLDEILAEIAKQHLIGAHEVQERVRAAMHLSLRYPPAGQAPGAERHPAHRRIAFYANVMICRVGDGEIVIRSVRRAAKRPRA